MGRFLFRIDLLQSFSSSYMSKLMMLLWLEFINNDYFILDLRNRLPFYIEIRWTCYIFKWVASNLLFYCVTCYIFPNNFYLLHITHNPQHNRITQNTMRYMQRSQRNGPFLPDPLSSSHLFMGGSNTTSTFPFHGQVSWNTHNGIALPTSSGR